MGKSFAVDYWEQLGKRPVNGREWQIVVHDTSIDLKKPFYSDIGLS